MSEYTKTSRNGNTFRTVTFDDDHVFIERNQHHEPGKYFLLAGIWTKNEAINKIDYFCRECTMTIYGRKIKNEDMDNIATYMDDIIREDVHVELAPCTSEEFIAEYLRRDPGFMEILKSEFDFEY